MRQVTTYFLILAFLPESAKKSVVGVKLTDFNRWSYRKLTVKIFLSTMTYDFRITSSVPLEIYARVPLLSCIQLVLKVNVNALIDYLSWYCFRHFYSRVIQWKLIFLHSPNIHRFCKLNVSGYTNKSFKQMKVTLL